MKPRNLRLYIALFGFAIVGVSLFLNSIVSNADQTKNANNKTFECEILEQDIAVAAARSTTLKDKVGQLKDRLANDTTLSAKDKQALAADLKDAETREKSAKADATKFASSPDRCKI